MSDDPKVDFYLANRALIEEWADLRRRAATALDNALLAAASRAEARDDAPRMHVSEAKPRTAKMHFDDKRVWVELWWDANSLLKGADGWPYLGLLMNPKSSTTDQHRVIDTTAGRRQELGMTNRAAASGWLRSGLLAPESEPVQIDAYADHCVERTYKAWHELREPIRVALQDTPEAPADSTTPG